MSPSSSSSWNRLVRFEAAEDGKIYQGEPQLPENDKSFDIGLQYEGVKVNVIDGDVFDDSAAKPTDNVKTIKKLLSPVSFDQITMFRCVGLNYVKHSELRSIIYCTIGDRLAHHTHSSQSKKDI